ncbi:uncharacterized protein LOC143232756 [Tachypleus tridentatus]|uniref:uncharacterized protein LOC143232756 n=1 Tax=Tachypleus tridentatus TaxID=6853 RepID=UPI003FD3BBC9
MFILARYYQQRREETEHNSLENYDNNAMERTMKKRAVQRELAEKRRQAATCGTLIYIFVSGSMLVLLGVGLTCTGVFASQFQNKKMPWLVTGPTFIVVGVLVLFLSIEIIIKRRKVGSTSDDSDSEVEGSKYRHKRKLARGWIGQEHSSINDKEVAPTSIEQDNKLQSEQKCVLSLVLNPTLLEQASNP